MNLGGYDPRKEPGVRGESAAKERAVRRFMFWSRVLLLIIGVVCVIIVVAGALSSRTGRSTGTPQAAPPPPPEELPEPGASAAPWPMFRGNPELTGVAESWLPSRLSLLWTHRAGTKIRSSAAIVDGEVYVGTDTRGVLKISLADGQLRWAFDGYGVNGAGWTAQAALATGLMGLASACPSAAASADAWARAYVAMKSDQFSGGGERWTIDMIEAAPTVADGRVFVGDEAGYFYAIEAATGRRLWFVKTGNKIISSALCVGDKVLVGSYDKNLYCLRAADGRRLWAFESLAEVHATPGLWNGRVVLAACDGYVRLINLETGVEEWSLEVGKNIASAPAQIDGRAFVCTYEGVVAGLDLGQPAAIWSYDFAEQQVHFYASVAAVRRQAPAAAPLVIVAGKDGWLRAYDGAAGQLAWRFAAKGPIDSSPVVAGDRVFFGSDDGEVYGLSLATGLKAWQFTAGDVVTASPAIGQQRLVIGSWQGSLYCFGAAGTAGRPTDAPGAEAPPVESSMPGTSKR